MTEPNQNLNLKAFNDVINLLMWFAGQPELLESPPGYGANICLTAAGVLSNRRDRYARKLAEEADDE